MFHWLIAKMEREVVYIFIVRTFLPYIPLKALDPVDLNIFLIALLDDEFDQPTGSMKYNHWMLGGI